MHKLARRIPWVIKYRPKRIAEVINQEEAKRTLVSWIKSWPNVSKKAALLWGPPGSGKTSLVEAIANEFGYELVEMNASDFRRAADIERIAMVAAGRSSLFGRKGKIILLDEVDGMQGRADLGGIEAIVKLVEMTKHPIVMTANDPWDPKLRPLRDVAILIEFKRLSELDVVKVLRRICTEENIVCEEDALRFIAQRSEGDLRSAINDLEALAEGAGKATLSVAKVLLRPRDREHNPFETLRAIFSSKYAWQAKLAASQSQLDYEQLIEWLNENIPNYITDPEELWKAYEALSRASVYQGRIIKSGSWDLLAYVMDLATAGVALAQKQPKYKWARLKFPEKIKRLAETKEMRELREEVAELIARHIHTSRRVVKSDVLPYVKLIFEYNPQYAAKLAIGLNMTDRMIKYLARNRYNEVMSYVKKFSEAIRREAEAKVREAQQVVEAKPTPTAEEKKRRESRRKTKETGASLLSYMKK